ncbi:hypothetical protein EYS42_06900 [Aquabacterium lacunae]|jgi:hypothetical protein|uniref:Uncharacterized protein n=1 Tax=Aquabacterium lacunae TaxID=2528630 RepID=A0A4V2JFW9_9BURK|nr:hypothetical protein [Aquabacterium lacunae]TBO32886.1 hypothetical protein EYS42_06900 [Aquabacterium lacunae]
MNVTAVPQVSRRLPFRQLLYRYWFFDWLFKDVNRATLMERAAAWRHNQEQARWLPLYLRRWAILTVLSFAVGMLMEHGLRAPVLSAVLYINAIFGFTFNAVTSVILLGFKFLPGPF